jgi:hypothetical protein
MSTSPANFPPAANPLTTNRPNQWLVLLRGLAGGAIGGVVGYLLFQLLRTQQFYALALPGAMVGLGAGLFARGRSQVLAMCCAAAAVILAIVIEWLRAPFLKDGSFLYFVTHLHQMDGGTVKSLMIGVGALCAYWFGQGR